MSTPSFVQADLADGTIAAVISSRVIDGIAGWAVAIAPNGEVWAYAPQWYALEYGEIARQLA